MKENEIVFFLTDRFFGGQVVQTAKVRNFIDGNFPIVELTNGHSFQLNQQNKWLSEEGWELQQCPVLDLDLSTVSMINEFQRMRKFIK